MLTRNDREQALEALQLQREKFDRAIQFFTEASGEVVAVLGRMDEWAAEWA